MIQNGEPGVLREKSYTVWLLGEIMCMSSGRIILTGEI